MIEVNGKKLSQSDANILLVQACNTGNLTQVVRCVEEFKADVNCSDPKNYARALMYALRSCNGADSKGELIVKYLVNNGADINFKHGVKGSNMDSRQYFIYFAAENTNMVSDDLVYFLVKKGGTSNLNYVPTTKNAVTNESAIEVIKRSRPQLYSKLIKEKLISNKNSR